MTLDWRVCSNGFSEHDIDAARSFLIRTRQQASTGPRSCARAVPATLRHAINTDDNPTLETRETPAGIIC
jgi:hypothetical protein